MKRLILALSVILASLASYRSPRVCVCAPGSSYAVLGGGVSICFGNYAQAAELDPRAPVTIQLSPGECVAIWNRTQSWPLISDDKAEALAGFSKACAFDDIAAKVAKADVEKRRVTDADFPGPRTKRTVPRDSLDIVVEALSPSRDRPVLPAQYAAFKKMRIEFGEVLAGRNPYTLAK